MRNRDKGRVEYRCGDFRGGLFGPEACDIGLSKLLVRLFERRQPLRLFFGILHITKCHEMLNKIGKKVEE